ncbi:MAG: hypothetical protein HQK77_15575 [Desulfobacterales bacterium]|nr:hypothetical protein [Desulfobacterales bacterium]
MKSCNGMQHHVAKKCSAIAKIFQYVLHQFNSFFIAIFLFDVFTLLKFNRFYFYIHGILGAIRNNKNNPNNQQNQDKSDE